MHSLILPQRPAFSLFHSSSLLVVSTYQLESSNSRAGALHLLSPDLSQDDIITTSAGVFRFQFLSDRIVSALTDGSLSIASLPQKTTLSSFTVSDNMLLDVSLLSGSTALTSDNSGRLFLADLDTEVVTASWNAHKLPYTGQGCEVWTCSFLSSSLCVSGAEDATMCLWDLTSHTKVAQSKVFGSGVVFTAPRGDNSILTGSYDEHVRLFDKRNLKSIVKEIKLPGGVWNIEQLSDGRCICACMYGGWVILDDDFNVIKKDEQSGSELLYGATLINSTLAYVTFNNYTVTSLNV